MNIKNYSIQFLAPLKNLALLLTFKTHRIPFIVNTANFKDYPQSTKYYIVEQDGIGGDWFAHDNKFINIIESTAVFGATPQEALLNYMQQIGDIDDRTN